MSLQGSNLKMVWVSLLKGGFCHAFSEEIVKIIELHAAVLR